MGNAEHPRIRGENELHKALSKFYGGTSPHTRGKREHFHIRRGRTRNIPAYAGKTGMSLFVVALDMEHPRIRGENKPLVTPCYSIVWNIPAYAGKT